MPDLLDRWRAAVAANDHDAIDDLLDDDVVFQSPAVHTPQQGKAITSKYLRAAAAVLNNPSFRYTGEWRAERSAVLEFELEIDGVYINGIDMMHWNEAGKLVRFKVMVRPLKALNAILPLMARELGLSR